MPTDGLGLIAFRRILTRSVVVPAALLGVLALIFLDQILYLLSVVRWVEHTDQVMSRANALLKLLVDGETGMRGFLLTGNPVFLEPYHVEENQCSRTFEELLELVSDNPDQVERLEALRRDQSDWQRFAQTVIDLRRQAGDHQTRTRSGEGKRRMDSLREQIAVFIAVEEDLREARTRTMHIATWVIVGVSLGLALLLGCTLAFLTRRQLLLMSANYQRALSVAEAQAASLRKLAYRLGTLHEIDRAILAAESVPELTCSALVRMEQFVLGREALVIVFDAGSGSTQVIHCSDPGTPLAVGLPEFTERDCPQAIPDLAEIIERSPVQDHLFRSGHRSCLAVPLEVDGRRFGVLVLADPRPSAFTDESQQAANEVARQLAIAFQQAQLREQLQRHASELERRVEERTRELQEALDSVKQLQGLLPICAWCKKVRDDGNYWHEVEHYITAHTQARFTHGICPECLKSNLEALERTRERPES